MPTIPSRSSMSRISHVLLATLLLVVFVSAMQARTATAQTPTTCDGSAGTASASSTPAPPANALPTEAAAAVEQNPPGDIPDNQAFVTYTNTQGGYAITMPEGWARQESGTSVVFTDKLHEFRVDLVCASQAPTVDSATQEATTTLAGAFPAFELVHVTEVTVPAGQAVLIQYRVNSPADPVTGKEHRLDVDRYEIYGNGTLAVVTLASPAGSDNVDVSRQVSESFQWMR
jgi:hypothetical protein